jgi:squalene-hopene/tetraprenyl-beta-curcumene cyclase
MRLVLWRRLDRPAEELQPLADRIQERQNEDGGWRQAPVMASDAWATGQALYALAHAGLDSANPAIRRGQDFLVRTQQKDGSWSMTSRPSKPGDEGASYLVPITCAGTAWGVIGLAGSR